MHNLLFGGWKSKSLEWFTIKYPDEARTRLPQVVDLRTGLFSFLGYANNSVLQQLELNTGSIEVDRSDRSDKHMFNKQGAAKSFWLVIFFKYCTAGPKSAVQQANITN